MSTDTIRVGVIGAGANTRKRHIPGLQAQEGVEVVAVANRTSASGQRVAEEFDIAAVYDDWMEIIEDDDIDAVCIGTWPYMHCPLTLAALDADQHVLVEARMAMNSVEAHAMLEASKANPGLVSQIVPAPHTLSVDRTMIDLISDGYIGDLISIKAQVANGSTFPDREAPLHWRHDRDLSGNNVMTMGIWYEALMRWVGPATEVAAMGQVVVTHRNDSDGRRRATTIPDHLDILCKMAAGGQANISVTTVSGLMPGPALTLSIHGTEGTLYLAETDFNDPAAPALELMGGRRGDAELKRIEIPEEKRGGWRVEEEFINAIRGVEPITHTTFTDGVKYMEFTDALSFSMRTGETIKLPLEHS